MLSNNKDVVSLIPVTKMTTEDLSRMTLKVKKTVTEAGYTIVSISSDNNIVNRKTLKKLSRTDHLVPYIVNSFNWR